MSWKEYDPDWGWVEKMEVANDSADEAPDSDDGWRYAGDNDNGSVYLRPTD